MNIFFGEHLGIEPDIWGTVSGMVLLLGALLAIPFVDSNTEEPHSMRAAFSLERGRLWAFVLIGLFWAVFIIGVIQNAVAGAG